MPFIPIGAIVRCSFRPRMMLRGLPPRLVDTITVNAVNELHSSKDYLLCHLMFDGLSIDAGYSTYRMSPLNTVPPRADGADGLTPNLALALGGSPHRSRRQPTVRAYPPMSVHGLYFWHKTEFQCRVLNTPVSYSPENTIMLTKKSTLKLLKWIDAAASSKMARRRVPSSGILSAELPPIIDGFPRTVLFRALQNILQDEFKRADKIALKPGADDFPRSQRPGDPIIPLFAPRLGKVSTVDEGVGGVYDFVKEVNEFTLIILQAVARFIRARPALSHTVLPATRSSPPGPASS